ncbi:hypothetical protein QQ045_030247 [Rhodiola kirilowii]
MAAKILESLTDDRKQIGCMTGFLHQLFEPNQALSAKRITNGVQGASRSGCEVEPTINPYLQFRSEMKPNRNSNDSRLGMYAESSRASCSSSSSFSSLDYSKVRHPEPSSCDRITFPESPLLDRSLSHSSSSWRMRQRSFDFNDSVKDFSCTTESAEESAQLENQDVSVYSEHKGPLRAPLRVKDDSLCFYDEDRKPSRLLYEVKKGTQHDGTEIECYRRETKETQKTCGVLDELARLSSDSKECSLQHSSVKTLHRIQRPPSIVEKLMGLEAMPRVSSVTQNRFVQIGERKDTNMISKSAPQASSAQRCLRKDMHRWRNGELVMKPVYSSRILVEPAPWKQPDVNLNSTKSAVNNKQGSPRYSNGFPPVYSKFEKRLKNMEFQGSSNDLKVLKQMLDAVQQNESWQVLNPNPDRKYFAKALKTLQQEKNQNACNSMVNGQQERCLKTMTPPIVLMKPFKLVAKSDIVASSVIRSEGTRHISKPHGSSANRRKSMPNTQMVKGQTPRNSYQSPRISSSGKKPTCTLPTMPQRLSKEKKTNSAVSAGSVSPNRFQQKKIEFEKKPRPATTSHDATKLSISNSKHPTSGEKPRLKSTIQKYDAQSSGYSSESKDTSCCGDDTEVTSKLRLGHVDGGHCPERKVVRPTFSAIRKHKPSRISVSSEDAPRAANPETIAPEQPSPVSVLDSTAYRNEPPPSKKMANGGKDIITGISSYYHLSSNATGLTTTMSREKLKHIEDLVNKLKGASLGSTNDESNTDFLSTLCETTNPDQRYISKILLASGFLLREFESTDSSNFQPHISGHPINPELFFVLEQTQSSALPTGDRNRSRRRLIFDCINENLAGLLVPSGMFSDSQSMPKKLAKNTITARQLLKNLCDRTEQLQAKSNQRRKVEYEEDRVEEHGLKNILFDDLMHMDDKWGNSDKSLPEVVLDIERMLFKDLVKEIVCDEAVLFTLRSSAIRSCGRKLLFNKI